MVCEVEMVSATRRTHGPSAKASGATGEASIRLRRFRPC